jgi:hypothetical protein
MLRFRGKKWLAAFPLKIHLSALRKYYRILIGGPVGLAAWGLSIVGLLAIGAWGLKAALPVSLLKAASWGIWSIGVVRESREIVRGG